MIPLPGQGRLWISPEDRLSQQNREHPRVEAAFRVRYKTLDDLVIGYSKNLSKGGLFLRTDRVLPVNSPVRLHVELPGGGGELTLACRVAYVRERAENGQPAGMGVQFVDPNAEVRERIEQAIAEFGEQPSDPLRPPRPISVLVVDDDAVYCELAAEPFRARGDTVRVARDGIEALAMCISERPDIVLSDVNMPKMDGWQLLRVLRARPTLANVPVIFLTTLDSEQERLLGYRLGIDDFIAKPYKPLEVQARCDRVVVRAEQSRHADTERKTLRGDVEQVGLPSVLSFLELERKTGILEIAGRHSAKLSLREGRPVRVEFDGAPVTEGWKERLFELLDSKSGVFEFVAGTVEAADEIRMSVMNLLLEHARGRDERARG